MLDTIANFDGLERLMVIAVGLDAPIDAGGEQVRSLLYRAVTRAHMMVVVVNQLLPGGWLEFLTKVQLEDTKSGFDAVKEAALRRPSAAKDSVKNAADLLWAVVRKAVGRVDNLSAAARAQVLKEVTSEISKVAAAGGGEMSESDVVAAVQRQAVAWRKDEVGSDG